MGNELLDITESDWAYRRKHNKRYVVAQASDQSFIVRQSNPRRQYTHAVITTERDSYGRYLYFFTSDEKRTEPHRKSGVLYGKPCVVVPVKEVTASEANKYRRIQLKLIAEYQEGN